MEELIGGIFGLIAFAGILWAVYWLFREIGRMSRRRGHNPWAWWLVAIFASPLASIFVLWMFFDVIFEDHEILNA